jgi:hypothetical protein
MSQTQPTPAIPTLDQAMQNRAEHLKDKRNKEKP